jgi:hypothetical protein
VTPAPQVPTSSRSTPRSGCRCAPQRDALELTWFNALEARDPAVLAELANGQSTLLLQALSYLGV